MQWLVNILSVLHYSLNEHFFCSHVFGVRRKYVHSLSRYLPESKENDNIIEQVTDFKYLGYCISEFKSDVEDKLQTYNKINGAIRRHFGKQMNKETKLRITTLELKQH